ncbi:phosphatidate cytidylyltransferase [Tissierella creatinophila]|uniref:Phosphatidate cytidylyltransferase n=1 Tax=Tissierella creatinophila DSM 6911 TaxID=1123403 RepID=A0A1U7M3A2_TISCR|nr:phosphatidate cytidylyltransferase [Tissierella creatinophila]OLS01755.1 phosphatidate cytidylyltransferase [Tissierella creatinophila DSM 6911]
MKETYKRVVSAIIGTILLLLIVSKGNVYLNTGVFIVSIIGLREFYIAIRKIETNPLSYIGYLCTLLIYLSNFYPEINIEFILTLSIILSLIIYLFSKKILLKDIGVTFVGILYIPFLFSYINYLENSIYIWLIFIISFGTDTFAYLGGRFLGKNKLWPEISPNKTIEGAISGIVGSTVLTVIFAFFIEEKSIYLLMILAIIVSTFSQIGDLIASKIKRSTKLKDYGHIMPGHGGVLDRFDSIILGAPLIYYYINYFLN